MLRKLKEQLRQYSFGQIDLSMLEGWIVSHLQDILDSGDEEAIQIGDEFNALLIMRGESLIAEKEIYERASTITRLSETTRIEDGQLCTSAGANCNIETVWNVSG